MNIRKPVRLKGYDYSSKGYYFITICSKDRENIFGDIKASVGAPLACAQNDIQLTILGKIIDKQWQEIPQKYSIVKIIKN